MVCLPAVKCHPPYYKPLPHVRYMQLTEQLTSHFQALAGAPLLNRMCKSHSLLYGRELKQNDPNAVTVPLMRDEISVCFWAAGSSEVNVFHFTISKHQVMMKHMVMICPAVKQRVIVSFKPVQHFLCLSKHDHLLFLLQQWRSALITNSSVVVQTFSFFMIFFLLQPVLFRHFKKKKKNCCRQTPNTQRRKPEVTR